MDTKKVVCSICEDEFWTRGNRAKYCSPECRKMGYYSGKSMKVKVEKGWRGKKEASQHKL